MVGVPVPVSPRKLGHCKRLGNWLLRCFLLPPQIIRFKVLPSLHSESVYPLLLFLGEGGFFFAFAPAADAFAAHVVDILRERVIAVQNELEDGGLNQRE